MHAHVNTYRLSTPAEIDYGIESAELSDQDARTLAKWWADRRPEARSLRLLADGLPFDTEKAQADIFACVTDDVQSDLLYEWLVRLEMHLDGLDNFTYTVNP
jgi:hypothetical protein